MREFILRVTNSQQSYEHIPYERLKFRLYHASRLGFNRVILLGEDVFWHPQLWDIVDYCKEKFNDIAVMTVCRYATSDDVQELASRGIRVLVPIQLRNPFEKEVIGETIPIFNAGESVDPRGLARHTNVTVWTSADGEQLQRISSLEDDFGIGVNIHYPTVRIETEQAIGITRWTLAHEQVRKSYGNGPDVEDVLGKPVQYAGTMYADARGDVRVPLPFFNDERPYAPIEGVTDDSIQELAAYYAKALEGSNTQS